MYFSVSESKVEEEVVTDSGRMNLNPPWESMSFYTKGVLVGVGYIVMGTLGAPSPRVWRTVAVTRIQLITESL